MRAKSADTGPAPRMTADEYLAWALDPENGDGGKGFELVDGEVVAMAPERAVHARVKARVWQALHGALLAAASPCEAFPDGFAVRVDEKNFFVPDALVRCGDSLNDDAVELNDPVIVVEVLSLGTKSVDTGIKFDGYFGLPSLSHYLIVHPTNRTIIHHARDADGRIQTTVLRGQGRLALDPPGIAVDVLTFFA